MFVCRACARRASMTIGRRLPANENRLIAPSRTFATSRVRRQSPPASEPQNLSSDWGILDEAVPSASDREADAEKDQGEMAAAKHEALQKMKRAVKIELRHTDDPYHIAENVATKLRHNEFEKALMLTREASRKKPVVVCWNYLIAHSFTLGKLQNAIKLFNEMKKRAQLPNAQTYTTIFRGCLESQHPKVAVSEALRIYNNMLASNRLQPNTIHLNALINLCARADDIESMFVALRTANGIRSPDNTTYTIILNALRCQLANRIDVRPGEDRQDALAHASRKTSISRAKLVWDEVMTRWKKNEITMDEELMCAMGRVLLLGGAAETPAVLRLVGEVLDLTKLLDGQPALIGLDSREEAPAGTAEAKAPDKARQMERADQFEESDKGEDFASSRAPQASIAMPRPRTAQVNAPSAPLFMAQITGNNTLSLLMRALALDRRTKLAGRYWDYMLHRYSVVPDRRNYRDYIDCLSTGSASGKAARALVSMPATIDDGNLYRRGLLLCLFDAYNKSAFDNATLIHRAMLRKLRVPDARCMKLYLQIARNNYHQFTDRETYPDPEDGLNAHAEQILAALDGVFEPLRLATNDLAYSNEALSTSPAKAWHLTWPRRQETLEVMQSFIAACNLLLSQNLVMKHDQNYQVTVTRRAVLSHIIDRLAVQSKLHGGPDIGFRRTRGRRHVFENNEGTSSKALDVSTT